jgi:hypothetical protein
VYPELGEYATSRELFDLALVGCKKHRGEDDPMTLKVMVDLGTAYANLDQHEKSEAIFIQGLEGQEKQLGAGHPKPW